MITLETAKQIVYLRERAAKLKNELQKLADGKEVRATASVRWQWGGQFQELHASANANAQIVGIIRREHELALADCIRKLNALGAELPK